MVAEGVATLTYAVRLPVLARYLSLLALVLAILTVVPLAVSIVTNEYEFAERYTLVLAFLLLISVPFLRLFKPIQLQVNEALTIVALAFVLAPALMVLPMMAAGLSVTDALFESVSGVTTTGLSTLAGVADKPQTFLFSRAWMQWYGGLGFVVFSIAIMLGHHVATRRLAQPLSTETMLSTTRAHARHVLAVYLALTLAGITVLLFLGVDPFSAVLHSLSAIATGGFSPYDQSLAGFSSWAPRATVMFFAVCGAVPLILYYRAVRSDWRDLVRDIEVRGLVVLCLLTSALVSASLHIMSELSWSEALSHGFLIGVSAQTSTGFTTLQIGSLDDSAKLVLIAAMFCGAGTGSAAGGFKILRLLILLRLFQLIVHRPALPDHAVLEPRLGGTRLDGAEIERALIVIMLYVGVVFLSWLVFVAFGYAPLDALFEVTSAAGTVGLSTGIVRPELETPLKLLLCFNMIAGRLEIIALLVLLYPRTWFGTRSKAQ